MTNDLQHACTAHCGCGLSRRQFLRLAALGTAAGAAPFIKLGDALAAQQRGDDQPVRIGYLPITDAAPLLIAHARKIFEQEGLTVEPPRLFRAWPQLVEAFLAGQVNVVHLLSPSTLLVRYGSRFPAKVVAWNHVNGSALTVEPAVGDVSQLGGKNVAIPFWFSIHNVVLQHLLRQANLDVVTRPRDASLAATEVNLVVLPPADMISALSNKSIAGYIVAEPFNAAAENLKVGKVLRFTGDVWKDHACCLVFMHERDLTERGQWSQRVVDSIVKAQAWLRGNRLAGAQILAKDAEGKYTPHPQPVLERVLKTADRKLYANITRNPAWNSERIDFQPYPFPSYTEELVRLLKLTRVEGDAKFLDNLDPAFAARDLVDDSFVKSALKRLGGLKSFGLAEDFARREVLTS